MASTQILLILTAVSLGAPAAPDRPNNGAKGRTAARSVARKAVQRIDRAHIVGSPVLDDKARPGLYIWLEDGRFHFAVVGAGRSAPTEFQLRTTRRLSAREDDGLTWIRKGSRHLMGRSRSGRGSLRTEGSVKVGRVRRGGRRARIYLGPLAQRATSTTVEIGKFGALKR